MIHVREMDSTPVKVRFLSQHPKALAGVARYWVQTNMGQETEWQLKALGVLKDAGITIPSIGILELLGRSGSMTLAQRASDQILEVDKIKHS